MNLLPPPAIPLPLFLFSISIIEVFLFSRKVFRHILPSSSPKLFIESKKNNIRIENRMANRDYTGTNLGGGFTGISPQQTVSGYKTAEDALTRKCLRKSWNTPYATGYKNGYSRITTPFRAVNNLGDFLSRTNYSCGGPNPINRNHYNIGAHIGAIPQRCDGTGVPASSCNVKFVADSSDYTRYRRQRAANLTYNDLSNVGDDHNGSYVFNIGIKRR